MIKRISLLLCLIYAGCFVVNAQTDELQRVRLGIKVAPAINWMKPNTKNIQGNGTKLGFSYGLMLDYNFTKNYALATGLEVCYRGGKLKDKTYSVNILDEREGVFNLQYLQLPVTIKLKTNEIGPMTYFGQIGLETGFNISAKGSDWNLGAQSGDKENIRSQVTPFNLALLVELGAEYAIGGHASLMISAYFSNGFIDIMRTVNPNLDARSNAVGLNVGVFF